MTPTDKALLLAEWNGGRGEFGVNLCPVCSECGVHAQGCVMDLALAERGYPTHVERNRAREFIEREAVATRETLPPTKENLR
jgi:hypothetical protein